MKMISWNVNGIRACLGKGFMDAFASLDSDFFCLQETKCQEGQVKLDLPGYEQVWHSAEKKGYSGTAIFAKQKPVSVRLGVHAQFSGRSRPPALPGTVGGSVQELPQGTGKDTSGHCVR